MAREEVIRSGRRIVGRYLNDSRTFYIAHSKSNVKGGSVVLPKNIVDERIANFADKLMLTITTPDGRFGTIYWLPTNEFMTYAVVIKNNYIVPLYNFKSKSF